MELKTRVFDLYPGHYRNLYQLARAMGIQPSQVYRVQRGERPVGEKFIIGAKKAFPEYELGDLFYFAPEECDG